MAASTVGSCARVPADTLVGRIDAAVARGVAFLVKQQGADGGFRSDTYGNMKDGITLTPHVLEALTRVERTAGAEAALRRGKVYLRGQIKADGTLESGPRGIPYFVYSVATAASVMGRGETSAEDLAARDKFVTLLRRQQLDERLGWGPGDLLYGGWGYSMVEPRKPEHEDPHSPTVEANLSATVYALEALVAAGVKASDPALVKARRFLWNVQNFPEAGLRRTAHDDGGFFFTPVDAARNKAGALGVDGAGRARFTSYGTMTADGVRALDLLGDHGPAFAAGHAWLMQRFSAEVQPGDFAKEQVLYQQGMYFYYAASVSRVMAIPMEGGGRNWARALAVELLARQRPDGSFMNAYTDSKEDDPLVATPQAVMALVECRRQMSGTAVVR